MKILVGHDESEKKEERLSVALEHAIAFNAEIHIVTSIPYSHEKEPDKTIRIEKELADIKNRFIKKGIKCNVGIIDLSLNPGEDLIRYAIDHEIDEIIIFVRKRSMLGKFIMGSVAQYVAIEAPCNVLLVK